MHEGRGGWGKVTLVHLSPLTQLFLATTKKLLTTFKCYIESHLTNRVWCYNFSGVAGIIAAAKQKFPADNLFPHFMLLLVSVLTESAEKIKTSLPMVVAVSNLTINSSTTVFVLQFPWKVFYVKQCYVMRMSLSKALHLWVA